MMYIAFEGIVGCGKTTQSKLLAEWFKNKGKKVMWTREPGGSEIAEAIRKVVQGTEYDEKMEPLCDAYLFAAARAQTRPMIKKALKESIVISDRSEFASYAFQGEAQGLGIRKVIEINKHAVNNVIPDLIIFVDVDPETGLDRAYDKSGDKFEKRDIEFFAKVKKGYEKLSLMPEYSDRWLTINGKGSIEEVHKRVAEAVKTFFGLELQ